MKVRKRRVLLKARYARSMLNKWFSKLAKHLEEKVWQRYRTPSPQSKLISSEVRLFDCFEEGGFRSGEVMAIGKLSSDSRKHSGRGNIPGLIACDEFGKPYAVSGPNLSP